MAAWYKNCNYFPKISRLRKIPQFIYLQLQVINHVRQVCHELYYNNRFIIVNLGFQILPLFNNFKFYHGWKLPVVFNLFSRKIFIWFGGFSVQLTWKKYNVGPTDNLCKSPLENLSYFYVPKKKFISEFTAISTTLSGIPGFPFRVSVRNEKSSRWLSNFFRLTHSFIHTLNKASESEY